MYSCCHELAAGIVIGWGASGGGWIADGLAGMDVLAVYPE
jgi:hypothetical protein